MDGPAASTIAAMAVAKHPLAAGAVIGAALLLAACSAAVVEPSSSEVTLTRGPIPDSARRADGSIDLSRVPDFIPAADGDRIAGWIASSDVMPGAGEARSEIIEVFADDLVTVVGHMYPEVGFVALGSEAALLPPAGQDRDLTIMVRNDSDRLAVLEIIEAADEVDHRPMGIAPPITLAAGEEREVRFQAPRDRWSLRLHGDLGFFFSDELGRRLRGTGFSLVVAPERVLQIDRGP